MAYVNCLLQIEIGLLTQKRDVCTYPILSAATKNVVSADCYIHYKHRGVYHDQQYSKQLAPALGESSGLQHPLT